MVVIVINITKQFYFTTNTNISALFPTERRREHGAMEGFHSSFPAKDFIPLTVNNYTNVFLDIFRACCFHSNVFLSSVAWFSYFLDITQFFKNFMLHFSCFLLLFPTHHSIFISPWSPKMSFFLSFFSNHKITLAKISIGMDGCRCWWLLFCVSWTRNFLLTSTG